MPIFYIYTHVVYLYGLVMLESERGSIYGHFITQRWPSVLLLLLQNATERRHCPPLGLVSLLGPPTPAPFGCALRRAAASIVLAARACARFMHWQASGLGLSSQRQFRFQFKADVRFNCRRPGEL